MVSHYINLLKRSGLLIAALLIGVMHDVLAKGGGDAPLPSAIENPVVITMVIIILILLLAIALLSFVVMGAMDVYKERIINKQKQGSAHGALMLIAGLCFSGFSSMAQDNSGETATVLTQVSNTTFYLLFGFIMLEMLVLFGLLYQLKVLLNAGKDTPVKVIVEKDTKESWWLRTWKSLNKAKPIEEEADIDMGHSYDGIRELDNKLPPWWLYGFYLCIIVSIVYMWRYHVSHTGPSSIEEFNYAMEIGEQQKREFLKNAANNVDENTITFLNNESDLAAGKEVFITMCAACHGKAGEGGVGPNLTDDYWLNGGSLKDIFKIVKYGRPEKGMRSWQEDYSPKQLAQIASYVKSIHATNPPNGKEKQGELFNEDAVAGDSTKLATSVTASE